MNLESLKVALQWLTIGQQVIAKGSAAFGAVKAALAAHGIEADTSALDAVIADGEARAARARAEANAPMTAAQLGEPHGSIGD